MTETSLLHLVCILGGLYVYHGIHTGVKDSLWELGLLFYHVGLKIELRSSGLLVSPLPTKALLKNLFYL